MNYLILGGAGFIGTHLSKRLIREGHRVVIVDNCSTSSKPTYDVEFYLEDINYSTNLERLVKSSDVVYFLAGSVGVKNVVENPYQTLKNNLGLATAVVPLLIKHNKPVLFASTSEVYGEGPFKESNAASIGSPDNLRWGYASAKLSSEFLIASSGVPFKIIRFFNVTGPGQLPDYGMVVPRFVLAAKDNKDILIHDTGSQVRSFCHVVDAVDMMIKLESAPNGVYNLGSDFAISIKDLADKVLSVLDSKSNISFKPLEQVYEKNSGDIYIRVPDLSKIKQSIDYKITRTLDDIIKDIAND
jgi:UDP-glucose 4-epimerase